MLGIFNVPPGNRQKSSMKKSLRKKILNFGTNEVLRKISPCNKKSYHFETLFSRTFFIQKRPRKKSYYSRKCMGTVDVYNHTKRGN